MKNNVFVVIPAYNEEKMIGNTLRRLKNEGYKNLIVVDDGSSDRTSEIAKKEGAIVCRHIINRGLGGALGTGLKCALQYKPNVIVTFDADGQHEPKDIEKIVKPILEDDYEVVVGSRLLDENEVKNMPTVKRIGNWGLNFVTYLMGGHFVTDSQSGLRAFSYGAAEKITNQLKSNRYEVSSEFIVLIKRNNLKFKEVPIKTIYTDYSMARGTNVSTGFKILFKLIIQKLI
ncbi:MAG: UDP-N-acetylglucosamine---dolichyl-phosphate N-acetylglucosaminyltransferase [Methanothermococcus sp.]|jgi:glycosyltransferase involved in cell wall biosynthesis|uniref:glycosyltransferase family 2 protein n=1 Tax=Methanothermococcus TaxID=155862 RepID=UPI0003648F25|nr:MULTISPECIES: glycosyltransferase family 2 protein [Methanothermococcus]MDK2790115.1 UDP-N-acetylglucosamine---dolichyl-phosphate N-acetylglucosaminyltransferase [Methanothermococcus sp.]MDK2988340.1 UDP-N-acetylglucosamine---dolichyl-phosphate N-acetylglucosaminyltransferase [Methanothermococcus sp.]